jgi:hypothetical protein
MEETGPLGIEALDIAEGVGGLQDEVLVEGRVDNRVLRNLAGSYDLEMKREPRFDQGPGIFEVCPEHF